MSALTPLFVYGTLKRGQPAASRLAGQRCLGPAQTGPGFTLHHLDGYPGMVRQQDPEAFVTGELWLVDDACLRALDDYEGVAEGLYRRESITLVSPGLPAVAHTYVYARSVIGRRRIGAAWPPAE